jgi:hypothetical protein
MDLFGSYVGTGHGAHLCVPEAGVVKAVAGGKVVHYGNHYFKVRLRAGP